MGTQVDDLTIKLQGDVKNAENAIDELIKKIGNLSSAVSNFGSKTNGGVSKAFSNLDFSGAKNKADKFQSYINRVASDMAKQLVVDFEIRDEGAKNRISELTQMLLKQRAEASKLSEETGQRANFNVEDIGKQLEYVIVQSHNVRKEASAASSEWKAFYDILANYPYKINIGKEGLSEIKAAIGEWKHLDGLIKQKFTSKEGEGFGISSLFDDFDSALNGQLQRLADGMDSSFTSMQKKTLAVIEALRLYRQELEELPKESADNISGGVWDAIIDKCSEVDKVTKSTFESIDSQIAKLREEIGDTGKNFATEGKGQFLDTAEKISAEIIKLKAHISDLKDKAALKTEGSSVWENYQKDIILTENQIDSLRKKLDKFNADKAAESLREFNEAASEKIDPGIKETGKGFLNIGSILSGLGEKIRSIDWASFGASAKSAFETTLNIVSKVGSAVGSLARTVAGKVVNSFKSFAKNIISTDNVVKRLSKSIIRIGKMLRLMILRMALRGVISEAKQSFTELTQFSDKVADNFNKLRNAIKYLADTLAALVAPIFKTSSSFAGIGYIIDSITDKIVDLINKLNQLLSALLGHSTWIKATKQTKDYTKEVDKAGKAAKKALQPFDELNNLTTNDSGTNPDNGTGGSQFQEQPIDPKWLKIADWLKDMWNKADFFALGEQFAKWLKNLLRSIPWDKIKAFMGKLGKSIATFFNGIFKDLELAWELGNAAAQAFNSLLTLGNEFAKSFNFKQFGKFVGSTISAALSRIDWDLFKEFAKNMGKGIADAINGLAESNAIREIGNALGNLLRVAIDFAFEIIEGIEFDAIGKEIVRGIKAFFARLSEPDETELNGWQKFGKAISDGILGILKILNTVLGDKNIREQVGKGITQMLNQIDFAGIIGQSAELIKNIAIGFANVIVAAFKSEEFRKGIATAIPYIALVFGAQLAGKGFAAAGASIGKTLLRNIGLSVIEGLPGLFASISGALTTAAAALGTSVGAILGALALVPAAVVVWVKNWDEIKEAAGLFVERTQEHWEELKSWFQTNMPYFSELVHKAFGTLPEFFNGVYISIKEKLSLIKTVATSFIEGIKIGFSITLNNIKNDISAKIEVVKTIIGNLKTFISNTLEFIKNLVEGVSRAILGGISGDLQEIYNGFVDTFAAIKKYVLEIIDQAKNWGHNLAENIKNGIANNPIVIGVKGVVNAFRNNADGGIFVNGQWKPIQGYASGGQPKSAEMFLARENGAPELVGKMGGHTAVANNDQIVASVSDGVYRAVRAAMSGQQGNTNVSVELVGDAAGLFKMVRKEGNEYQRRTGNPVFA